MTDTTRSAPDGRPGPVVPTADAISTLRPLALNAFRVDGGFWGERMQINRERSLRHGYEQLERAGNFHNFRLAAGTTSGSYRALGVMFDGPFPFLDSDVYKWLEAVGWELGRQDSDELRQMADLAIGLVQAAQRNDGYLNTFVQVIAGGNAYRDLQWGHELYTLGHLVQAAIAWQRALGDERLMQVVLGAVGSVQRELGSRTEGPIIDGHPEFEMALVELYRTTADGSHLELARRMIDARGHGALGPGRFGAEYWQDHLPVREARMVTGHAVRQLYLECGVVDVAVETRDQALLDTVLERWREMRATRTYLTGGVGSRHRDEAFGDPYELPPDQAYTESCAGIASVMLAWRLLLATGDAQFADAIERALYNAVLPGISSSGDTFFYVNPLQRRTSRMGGDNEERQSWYPCACCPPNLMRTLSSLPSYAMTADAESVQIHQYASGQVAIGESDAFRLAIETDYPWSGSVRMRVVEAPEHEMEVVLRVPAWSRSARLTVAGQEVAAETPGQIGHRRTWRAGDSLQLDLDMPPRVTWPDERVDAVRGCAAIERGPLVYCLETADLPDGIALEDIRIDVNEPLQSVERADLPGSSVGVRASGARADHPGRARLAVRGFADRRIDRADRARSHSLLRLGESGLGRDASVDPRCD